MTASPAVFVGGTAVGAGGLQPAVAEELGDCDQVDAATDEASGQAATGSARAGAGGPSGCFAQATPRPLADTIRGAA